VSAIDSVGQLSFHTLKFSALPRLKLPCYYLYCQILSSLFNPWRSQ
jgi:hypothetical protein